jgi:hypothetical protein
VQGGEQLPLSKAFALLRERFEKDAAEGRGAWSRRVTIARRLDLPESLNRLCAIAMRPKDAAEGRGAWSRRVTIPRCEAYFCSRLSGEG